MKLVLIVEDNEDNRHIYCTILRHYGYKCIEVPEAEFGIGFAIDAQPDIILLDIGLPRMDGWQACRILKSNPATKHIPVVAISAHAFEEDRRRGAEAGFDEYISKPAEPRTILNTVQRFI